MKKTSTYETIIEKKSDLELIVTRTFNAPVKIVYEAFTNVELFKKWWVPKSYGLNLVSCEMDIRVGGQYRLAFLHEGETMEFFGTYLEVTPNSRLVWTNDEGETSQTITTVTFKEADGKTQLQVHDQYQNPEAMDTGSTGAMPEVMNQLEELLISLG